LPTRVNQMGSYRMSSMTKPYVPAEPHFGFTPQGKPVHLETTSHLPDRHVADRFNSWLAVKITTAVGTMWCAYIFAATALISLPPTLKQHSVTADVQWVAQTFLQLVLLSVIIVGQNIQSRAADARQEKTFEHTETIMDRVDENTQGGIKAILDAVAAQDPVLYDLLTRVNALEKRLPAGE
jgi:hypothetical protein